MSKGKATFTEADLKRAMRAAATFGSAIVEVTKDGTIRIIPNDQFFATGGQKPKQKPKTLF